MFFFSEFLLLTVAFFTLSLSLCLPFYVARFRFESGVTALFQEIPSPLTNQFFSLCFFFY